jgi:hypothetical protein
MPEKSAIGKVLWEPANRLLVARLAVLALGVGLVVLLYALGFPQGLHWCETFFCSLNGILVGTDIRLDNVTWQAAHEALEAWHIAPPEGYRSGRHFFLAMPIQK